MTAPACTIETYATRAEWLEARRKGIGGSDAPAVLGLDPWTSPALLYAHKAGLIGETTEQSEAMEMGHYLEPIIRLLYADKSGRQVIGPRPWLIHRSRLRPFMHYSPDGWAIDPERGRGVLQCKAVNEYKGREWDEEPPIHYLVQLQHEMAVEGAAWGVLAAIIGGRRFRYFEYDRHDRLIAELIEREAAFTAAVAEGIAPPMDGSEASRAVLQALHPRETPGAVVELPADAEAWDRERQEAGEEIRRWEAIKEDRSNKIRAAIGDAAIGMLPGNRISYAWTSSDYHYKATEARTETRRVLRRRERS